MENSPFIYATAPLDHQRAVFESTRDYQYFAYFWEMGLGKSKVIIDTAQWLYKQGRITTMVVTAEKGYYLNWELEEIPKHWPKDMPLRVMTFTSASNAALKKQQLDFLEPFDGFTILIVNIESLSRLTMAGAQYTEKFIKTHGKCLMVVDESTTIKSMQAGRTKVAIRLGKLCSYRRILTGTPITQSPLDMYGQCEFLKHGILGFNSFTSFRAYYSIMQPTDIYVAGGTRRTIMQVVGFRGMEELTDSIRPFSSRLRKTDVLNLPEKTYSKLFVDLTPDQQVHINRLRVEAMTLVGQGLVTLDNALTLLTKTLQVASGHIKDDDGNTHRIQSNKPAVLKELLENIPPGHKVIVWASFQEDMQIIKETLAEANIPGWEVSGRVDQKQRQHNIDAFRAYSGKCVIYATPRTMGKSITLTESDYTVYYSNGFNLEQRLQSEDRNHRIGQKNPVMYYDLICQDSPDLKVVRALQAKEVLAKSVVENLSSFFGASE